MSSENKNVKQLEPNQVPEKQRNVGLLTLCLIWIGFTINGGLFLMGSVGIQAGVQQYFIIIFIAMFIVCLYAALGAYIGSKEGVPGTAAMAMSFGTKGKIIPAITMWIAAWGWFGIQLGVMGTATHLMMVDVLGMPSNLVVQFIVWGIIMTAIGTFGYDFVAKMDKIAVPMLGLIFLWMIIAILNNYDVSSIYNYKPEGGATLPFLAALNILPAGAAAFFIGGTDTSRFAKTPKTAIKAVFLGYGLPTTIILLIALVGSAIAGSWDPATIMTSVGLGALGVGFLILAGITTNSMNVYWGGIAFANITNLNRSLSSVITGGLGTVVAVAGIYSWNGLTTFLTYEGAFLIPSGAVLTVEYYILRKRSINVEDLFKRDEGAYYYSKGWHIPAVIAVVIGAIWGLVVPTTFVPAVSAFIITFIVYYGLRQLTAYKTQEYLKDDKIVESK